MSEENVDITIFSNVSHDVEQDSNEQYVVKSVKNGLNMKQDTPLSEGCVENNNILENGDLPQTEMEEHQNENDHCLVDISAKLTSESECSTDLSTGSSPDLSTRNKALNISHKTESTDGLHNQNSSLSTNNSDTVQNTEQNGALKDIIAESPQVMNGHLKQNQTLPLSESHVPYESTPISEAISLEELTETLLSETSQTSSPELCFPQRYSPSSSNTSSTRPSPTRSEPKSFLFELNGISGSIMNHPAYKMAMHDMLALREQIGAYKKQIARYTNNRTRL
jgi:hypothetical protein